MAAPLQFRLSTYLTLALACFCLGWSERDLLPESLLITGAVIVLIIIAYRVEGRWSLSPRSANVVGGLLALGLVFWIAFQFVRSTSRPLDVLPFPANLLPYLGPVLMVLIPAKMFRPKSVADFWAMQGIGLMAVALACAMANDILFGFALAAYFLCVAWNLTLFYFYRESNRVRVEPLPEINQHLGLMPSLFRWSFAAMAMAGILFAVTPRPAERQWEMSMMAAGRIETGLPEGMSI